LNLPQRGFAGYQTAGKYAQIATCDHEPRGITMNFTDILGSVLNQGMAPSSGRRLDQSLGGNNGGGLGDLLNQLGNSSSAGSTGRSGGTGSGAGGGLGDILGQLGGGSSGGRPQAGPAGSAGSSGGLGDILGQLGGSSSGGSGSGLLGSLAKMAGAAMKSGPGGSNNSMVSGGLGALLGALVGGGGSSFKGALGGTALAVLGSLAMKALSGRASASPSAQLMAGLRPPENEHEQREVQNVAELTVRAMLNAAKADGRIDRDEINNIVGKASEDGLTEEEQQFIAAEIKKPMETEALVRDVPNEQVAAQVYAASLLAIEVDTDNERRYLHKLAADLGLDNSVVSNLHNALGVA